MSDEYDERASKLVADLARGNGDLGGDDDEPGGKGKKKKKGQEGKKGKKRAWLVIVPLVLVVLAGGTYGALVAMGKVKSPLVAQKPPPTTPAPTPAPETPEAAPEAPTAADIEAEAAKAKKKADAERKAKADAALAAAELGAKKIAKAWETMDADALAKIAASYNDADLSRVLNKMDSEKVGAVLAALDPKRAAKVSRSMEALAGQATPASS